MLREENAVCCSLNIPHDQHSPTLQKVGTHEGPLLCHVTDPMPSTLPHYGEEELRRVRSYVM